MPHAGMGRPGPAALFAASSVSIMKHGACILSSVVWVIAVAEFNAQGRRAKKEGG